MGNPTAAPAPRSGSGRWRHYLLLFLALLACYAYFPPRWGDWNQNSRFNLVMAMVEDGTVRIDKYVGNTGDFAYYEGHYYSDKAPGLALLGVPVYAAGRALLTSAGLNETTSAVAGSQALEATLRPGGAGVTPDRLRYFAGLTLTAFIVVAVPSAAMGALFYWLAGQLGCGLRQRLAATLLFGLATSAFPYANTFVGHQPAAAMLLGAFGLLLLIKREALPRTWLVGVGLLLGWAVITEYPTALIAGLLGLYAMMSVDKAPRVFLSLAVGATPPLLLMAAHNLISFGTPLPVGYAHSLLWEEVHGTGFMSLTYPHPEALWGVTFGVHRGLFFLSPFLLFAIPGYFTLFRDAGRRPEFWVLLLAPLSFLLFNASSVMWQGGYGVGPRYLLPSLPFLALAAAVGLGVAWRRPAFRPLVVAFGAWSFFAVWTQTIAGQSFPDYTPNPLIDFSLPKLLGGDIARNLGMLLGLSGWASLLPLLALLALVLAVLIVDARSRATRTDGDLARQGGRAGWAPR